MEPETTEIEMDFDPQMIWACEVEDGKVCIFINQTDTITLDPAAAAILYGALSRYYAGVKSD